MMLSRTEPIRIARIVVVEVAVVIDVPDIAGVVRTTLRSQSIPYKTVVSEQPRAATSPIRADSRSVHDLAGECVVIHHDAGFNILKPLADLRFALAVVFVSGFVFLGFPVLRFTIEIGSCIGEERITRF